LGSTDEAVSLNEVSTLPGMGNAPYLGTWVMKDKGMVFPEYSNIPIWRTGSQCRQSDSEQSGTQSGRIKKTDSETMIKESILTNFSKV